MITINGADISPPDNFCVEILSMDRNLPNARGNILTDVIGVKRRVTLEYKFIDAESLSNLFALLGGDINLLCPDPVEGENRGGNFFCERRKTGPAAEVDGVLWWRDAVVVLTER